MATQPSENEICKALLDFAAEGTYPDSENIVAANVPSSAISKELELITQARDQVEVGDMTNSGLEYPSIGCQRFSDSF